MAPRTGLESKLHITNIAPALQQSLLGALPRAAQASRLMSIEPPPVPTAATPAGQTAPTTSVQVLTALAEPVIERRRKIAAEAERGLDMLERLHVELLQG